MSKRFCIIAGESSGDLHGANLVTALRERTTAPDIFGFGGAGMRRAGMDVVIDSRELAVVGITEVLGKLPVIRRGFRTIDRLLRKRRPDLLILIDFPDFNLRVAAKAKKMGIPVLYYISPQIWAWRRGRVKTIARIVDHMAVILPFEAAFYRDHGVPVSFVGHPLLDEWTESAEPPDRKAGSTLTIGLLPGSRLGEIRRLLPGMMEAANLVARKAEGIRFVISQAPEVDPELVNGICRPYLDKMDVEIDGNGARYVFGRVDLIVAASGTVTLEAAMSGTPLVVVYKVSPVSFILGRMLIRVPHIALANLIAGSRVAPELIQHQATPTAIANEVLRLIDAPERLQRMRERLLETAGKLGQPGASVRVAEIALDLVESRESRQ